METSTDMSADTARLRPAGEMNIYFAHDLKQSLLAQLAAVPHEQSRVLLDMGAVTALDTAGVQLIELLRREAQHADKTLELTAVPPLVSAYLAQLNLGPRFGLNS